MSKSSQADSPKSETVIQRSARRPLEDKGHTPGSSRHRHRRGDCNPDVSWFLSDGAGSHSTALHTSGY
jgi:hypothetical protein